MCDVAINYAMYFNLKCMKFIFLHKHKYVCDVGGFSYMVCGEKFILNIHKYKATFWWNSPVQFPKTGDKIILPPGPFVETPHKKSWWKSFAKNKFLKSD